ncbi:hypothetical protein [Sphingobium sp.]|uniref:hypothetical protein n=1 Tax=Sphingobium sp. TaxID=1912891 RepID=UPI0029BFB6DA|nr:hypothetical protein [Sphingobium sp.]
MRYGAGAPGFTRFDRRLMHGAAMGEGRPFKKTLCRFGPAVASSPSARPPAFATETHDQ